MRLRRRIATLLMASISLSTSAIALSNPTSAGAFVPGVVDVAVSIEARPSVVSPPGAHALFEVVASNAGVVEISSSTVTVSLPAGSVYDDSTSTPACSGTGTTVTCPVGALAVGASERLDIVSSTPTIADDYAVTASIVENDPLVVEPLEYSGNNQDAATVSVQAQSGTGVYALLRGGDSATLTVGDGRILTMRVPDEVVGVITSIEPAEGFGYTCGAALCGKGFLTRFVEDHPVFKAEDPAHPIETSRTFGPYSPCQGLGDPSSCSAFYFTKDPLVPTLTRMPACDPSGTATPAPCRDGVAYKLTPGGYLWADVNMQSNDPLELPPLSLGR